MPTFTAISFDTLIEPGGTSRSSSKTVNGSNPVLNSQLQRRNSSPAAPTTTTTERKYHRAQISPSLYATPEVTPLPDTPCSFPPSPYIINHKRRGPRLLKSLYEEDVSSCKKPRDKEKVIETLTHAEAKLISVPENVDGAANDVFTLNLVGTKHGNSVLSEEVGSSGVGIGVAKENKTTRSISSYSDEESDVFYDQLGSGSVRTDTDGATDHSFKLSTSTVFYDAWEELSSDGASQSSFVRDVDDEIREMRLSLVMEIEKRKQAEESLVTIRTQWQRIREQLSLAGLTLPADITVEASKQIAEDLCQQLYLVRFVADSVGRGIAKAEMKREMESQIEAKNVEIARLTDRLHYYEAVNQEMSQRNQNAVEVARRDWQRRKTRQKWIWGSIAAAITFGTAALAWSFNQPGTRALSSSDHAGDPEHHDSPE